MPFFYYLKNASKSMQGPFKTKFCLQFLCVTSTPFLSAPLFKETIFSYQSLLITLWKTFTNVSCRSTWKIHLCTNVC